MAYYIKSSDIKVYPASSRGIGDELKPYAGNPESKLFTENNIVELINRIAKIRNNTNNTNSGATIDVSHSFVISDSINDSPFEICINGYYFAIKDISPYLPNFSDDSNIYAKIIVKSKSDNYSVSELVGYSSESSKVTDDLDTNAADGEFIALSLDSNSTITSYSGCSCYCLHILTKVNDKWDIPSTSKIVISADYLGLSDYNGKLHNLYEYFEKDNTGNLIIKQSNKLQYRHSFWGQDFDGTQDVRGNLSNVGDIKVDTSDTYTIGESDKKFKSAYIANVTATTLVGDTITPNTSSNSSIGASNTPYSNAYINNITTDSIVINRSVRTSNMTTDKTEGSSIGTESVPYENIYANKLSGTAAALDSTNVGSNNTPVYFDAEGKPQPITYKIESDVPSNAKFSDTTYDVATESSDGLMSASDKVKLNGIAPNANNYVLPSATKSTLGGVKISLDSNGILTISVN